MNDKARKEAISSILIALAVSGPMTAASVHAAIEVAIDWGHQLGRVDGLLEARDMVGGRGVKAVA